MGRNSGKRGCLQLRKGRKDRKTLFHPMLRGGGPHHSLNKLLAARCSALAPSTGGSEPHSRGAKAAPWLLQELGTPSVVHIAAQRTPC